MTTFEELILSAEVEQDQAIKRREKALGTVKYVHAAARQDGRARLTEDEDAEVTAAMETHARAESDLSGTRSKLAQLKTAKAAEDAADSMLNQRSGNPADGVIADRAKPAYDQVARVGREERTYNLGNTGKGGAFLRDVVRQFLYRDPHAEQRLLHHMQEERVERGQYLTRAAGDANTGAFAGLVVPQYLTDMYAPAVAARRPFADICNHHDLPPDGMTVNISRITTPTTVALQATELAAVSATSIDDTLLTVSVQTAAGQQLMSRQAIDRGTGIEGVVMDDLFRRYATTLDSTLINQATTGLAAIATNVLYDDTTPTAAELYPKIIGAAAGSEAALLAQAMPTHAIMHSRRWYFLSKELTSTWPFINSAGIPTQAGGTNNNVGYDRGVRGVLPNGLRVIVDNNCATNLGTATSQDEIYVVPADECHLWEDPAAPVFIRAEQPAAASLGVLLVLYGYFAYTFGRYSASHQKVGGTGMNTPVF